MKKVQSIFSVILLVGCFFMSQLVVAFLGKTLAGGGFARENQFLLTLGSYILLIGGLMSFDRYRKKDIFEGYRGFNCQTFYKYILCGIGLWLVTTVINAICLPLFPEYGKQMDTLFQTREPILRFIVLVIGAPLVEEYIFRGKIQAHLKSQFGMPLAVIGQGLIFGMIHPFGLQKIYASVLGISFGWIREKKGNLMSCTIMHMTINFIGWFIGCLSNYYL